MIPMLFYLDELSQHFQEYCSATTQPHAITHGYS
jgi:hypothetical protein